MGDNTLVRIAEDLCKREPAMFSHIISHTVPKKGSMLSRLQFIDATLLYRMENLDKAFPHFSPAPINYEESIELKDCQEIFMAAQDRMCPIPLSSHYNLKYFYDLLGYFKEFFTKNKSIDTIIIDNTPHMTWDICLFFLAKKLNINTLFLRKTGISGFLYLDQDFRPSYQNWNYSYSTIDNPLNDILDNNKLIFDYLKDNSFTKGQIGGSWPKSKQTGIFRKLINLIKGIGLSEIVHLIRILTKSVPNNTIGANHNSHQITIYAGLPRVTRYKHFRIHRTYINRQRKYIKVYNKLSTPYEKIKQKKYIYFPLHLQPERSTLPEGLIFNDQVLAVRLLSASLPKDWIIIIKEHPKQHTYDLRGINSRSSLDYKRLERIDGVYLTPINENHNHLIKNSQMTATISGSVSWEGLLEGKPSLVFSEVWHHQCKSTKYIDSSESIKQSIKELMLKSKKDVTSDICNFIRNTIKFYIHGGLNNNHIEMFFNGNEEISRRNISNAILERISL